MPSQDAGQPPSSDETIHCRAHVRCPPLVPTKRQIHHEVRVELVTNVEVRVAERLAVIESIKNLARTLPLAFNRGSVIQRFRQRIVEIGLKPLREPFAEGQLQRVIAGLSEVRPRRQPVELMLEERIFSINR